MTGMVRPMSAIAFQPGQRDWMWHKTLSLLNSYTPKEVRQSCLEVLNAMLILYPNDFSEAIIPIIHGSHQHWNKTSPPGLLGPYFPRRHTKVIVSSKSVPRPAVPELNMFLHPSFLDSPKGVEESYDAAVTEYFQPYHSFVDKLLRFGFNQDKVPDHVIACSCLLAVEAISLHFTYFSKLWMEVYQKAGENTKYSSCIKQLCQQPEFLEVSKQVLVNQWTNLVKTLVTTVIADRPAAEKASDADLCVIAKRLTAELRAMSLLFSVRAPQKSDISPLLQPSLDALLSVCRRYQNKKQENAKATRAASETEQQQKNEESEDKKTGGEAEPVKKRRRTLEGEEQTSSKGASASSDVPGPSKDDDKVAGRKREKVQSSSKKQSPKSGSIWGSRPPTDCVDSLVKAIQSAITKIPV
ncbi:ubiquitin carboxyl-terminal hydrolase 34-like [Porites lutea]|uniref:ubiquitin carboxyl-terminal hydrolase 34-like n=1 Tax=Porites lutea TaxID=51062 RepID=UPI003CC56CB5